MSRNLEHLPLRKKTSLVKKITSIITGKNKDDRNDEWTRARRKKSGIGNPEVDRMITDHFEDL